MNSTKSYIAMALIASLAIQPITAQPIEQAAKQQSKIVKQLKVSYKSLTKHLKCAVKRNCTPEQKKRIRRTIYALVGTLIALYVGKKAWKKRLDYQAGRELKARPDKSVTAKKPRPTIQSKGLKPRPATSFTVKKTPNPPLEAEKWKGLSPKKEYNARLKKLPASSSNPNFAKNIDAAKLAAKAGNYLCANVFLKMAESVISKESKK